MSSKEMVILGSINSWKFDDWLELSQIKNWTVNKSCDVVRLGERGIEIALLDGQVKMVSLNTVSYTN